MISSVSDGLGGISGGKKCWEMEKQQKAGREGWSGFRFGIPPSPNARYCHRWSIFALQFHLVFVSLSSHICPEFHINLSRISSHICPEFHLTSSIMLFQLHKSHKYFLDLSIFTWSLKQILLSEFSYKCLACRQTLSLKIKTWLNVLLIQRQLQLSLNMKHQICGRQFKRSICQEFEINKPEHQDKDALSERWMSDKSENWFMSWNMSWDIWQMSWYIW